MYNAGMFDCQKKKKTEACVTLPSSSGTLVSMPCSMRSAMQLYKKKYQSTIKTLLIEGGGYLFRTGMYYADFSCCVDTR